MLVVNEIGSGVVRYFTDGRHPGEWSERARSAMGLSGAVDPTALRAVLQGRHPADGSDLPGLHRARHRPGWDLIFAAPKSLSIVAATVADGADMAARAHVQAFRSVADHLDRVTETGRHDHQGRPIPAGGLISAAFHHVHNGAGEPHLHTHLLVANLTEAGGRWGSVRNEPWFVGRRALTSLYQLELRHRLAEAGLRVDWRLRPDGLADLADVPRAAVRAASHRSHTPGKGHAPHPDQTADWERAVAHAGYRRDGMGHTTAPPGRLDDALLHRAVTHRLGLRQSDFNRNDVIAAVAACHAPGATVPQVSDWVERYCGNSIPVVSQTARPRWTSVPARQLDERLAQQLVERAGCDTTTDSLCANRGSVAVLGAEPGTSALLAQADLVDAARPGWLESGLVAAVSAPSAQSAQRWHALTGLPPYHLGDRADILIVDQADRRPSSDLMRLAARPETRLVLVEGGTAPALSNPVSHGFRDGTARLDRIAPGQQPRWRAGADIVGAWERDRSALMVGLGPEEVQGLNRAALSVIDPGRRPTDGWADGDRVVVLRGLRHLPYGAFGTVGDGQVRWDDDRPPVPLDRQLARRVGHGYAVTPHLAARTDRPLLLLGQTEGFPLLRDRVVMSHYASRQTERRGPALELG